MIFFKGKALRFFVFACAFVFGIMVFWTSMLGLAVLDKLGVIEKYNLSYETRQIILDIQCGDDEFCRGEKCRH